MSGKTRDTSMIMSGENKGEVNGNVRGKKG